MPEIEHGMVFYGGRTKKRNNLNNYLTYTAAV